MGVRDSIKQEDNIQYRTYYENEYNWNKNKKEIYADLTLGMEERNKDTIETQGKKTSTTRQPFKQEPSKE